jgi:hypothetical protein
VTASDLPESIRGSSVGFLCSLQLLNIEDDRAIQKPLPGLLNLASQTVERNIEPAHDTNSGRSAHRIQDSDLQTLLRICSWEYLHGSRKLEHAVLVVAVIPVKLDAADVDHVRVVELNLDDWQVVHLLVGWFVFDGEGIGG